MFFLFECGNCSNLYQIQAEKISNALQKITCPSCKVFYYFSAWDSSQEASQPAIERVNTIVGRRPSPASQEPLPEGKEIFWKCGICDSNYHFNMNRVSSNGIKITCNTCFQFFVLQKISNLVDLDHVIYQEVSNKILLQKPADRQPRDFLSTIDEKEVSGRFDISSLKTSEISSAMGEKKPEFAPKTIELSPTDLGKKDASLMKTMEISPSVIQKKDMSVSKEKTQPDSKENTEPNRKPKKTVPPTPLKEPQEITAIRKAPLGPQPADQDFIHSFKSYHVAQKKFKMDKNFEGASVTFTEKVDPEKKNYLEKNMVKISLWVIGISSISFAAATAYDHFKAKKTETQIQEAPPAPDPTVNKPKYGFPDLGE